MTPSPRRFHRLRATLDQRQPDLTVLMDQVNKGHNFSAILRNCDAVGVMGTHVVPPDRGRFDLFHHTSAGTAKWVDVTVHRSVEEAIDHLHGVGFQVVAAHLSPRAQDYRAVDYTRPTAILMGAELHGVSEGALSRVDHEVIVPMRGMAQSLNVSVATALLLFEAMRQREDAGMYAHSRLDPALYLRTLFRWTHPRLARWFDERGLPYPDMDADGEVKDPFPPGYPPSGELDEGEATNATMPPAEGGRGDGSEWG